jgi:hypothetical protein
MGDWGLGIGGEPLSRGRRSPDRLARDRESLIAHPQSPFSPVTSPFTNPLFTNPFTNPLFTNPPNPQSPIPSRSKQPRVQVLLCHRRDVERRREGLDAFISSGHRVHDARHALERAREQGVGLRLAERQHPHRR